MKKNNNTFKDFIIAKDLVNKYHEGQKDKVGKLYINHLWRVSFDQKTYNGMIVGLLHDLLEDTNFQKEYNDSFSLALEEIDRLFGRKVGNALYLLTKSSYFSYSKYIKMLCNSKYKLAIEVKLSDLKDNMNLFRLNKIRYKDIKRFFKYLKSYVKLKLVLFKLKINGS